MRTQLLSTAMLALLVAACGSTDEQRAASGGLTGAGVGALVGGPVGALAGAAVGAGGGAALDEGVVNKAEDYVPGGEGSQTTQQGSSASSTQSAGSGSSNAPNGQHSLAQAQARLQRMGLYDGQVDGIMGPKTRAALARYQQQQGLTITTRLDQPTRNSLFQSASAQTGQSTNAYGSSGKNGTSATDSGQSSGSASQSGASGNSSSHAAAGSGSSGSSAANGVSEQQVRNSLQSENYVSISNLRRDGDAYHARAMRDARSYDVAVDADTGALVSANLVNPQQKGALAGGKAMPEERVRQDLQNEGYAEISGLQRQGDAYWAQAQRNGHTYNLKVDAQSGMIISLNMAGRQTRGQGSSTGGAAPSGGSGSSDSTRQ